MSRALLQTEKLTKQFGGLAAVDGVDLGVETGTIHSLIGPNAAGKTTLFNLITGELPPTAGRVRFNDQEITGLPTHRIPHLGIGRCFQRSNIFPMLSAFENVWVAAYSRSTPGALRFLRRRQDFPEISARVAETLAQVGLLEKGQQKAGQLSHGQQRALEVAITLAISPTLLLLDEPTQGLSPEATQQMMGLIQGLGDRYTILLIEHKMHVVFAISDRISVMHFGKLIAEGRPVEIQRNELVQRAYLGGRR
ncbi:MAG: ABC transporter ATP-binding protein [Nitrospinae bacterium]|nr:ABC transporter ATP-binding protein [Nitrospinota bacterium]